MGIGGAVASIAGGLISNRGASKAADAQTAAANRQMALQGRIYDENVARFAPYEGAGRNALAALNYELGLGGQPVVGATPLDVTQMRDRRGRVISGRRGGYQVDGRTFSTRSQADAYARDNATGGTPYGGYEASQGHMLRTREGLNAIDASAAARGGLFSGAALQALERGGQEYAQLGYDNYLNRLTGLASSGQNAAGQGAAAGANYAQGASNALDNIGNAQSAGAIGQANAWNNAIGNGIGMWQYQNSLSGQGGGNTGGAFGNALFGQGPLFGGNSWG